MLYLSVQRRDPGSFSLDLVVCYVPPPQPFEGLLKEIILVLWCRMLRFHGLLLDFNSVYYIMLLKLYKSTDRRC